MSVLFDIIGAALIIIGLAGAVVPALPGIPLIFAGIWLVAATDGYHHLGAWWLSGIASLGVIGVVMDLAAGALGAKRVGASKPAVLGALIGTLIGLFLGLPGLLIGPFAGAVVGELSTGSGLRRSADVGVSARVGLIFGTLIKLVTWMMMVALAGAAWWLNRATG